MLAAGCLSPLGHKTFYIDCYLLQLFLLAAFIVSIFLLGLSVYLGPFIRLFRSYLTMFVLLHSASNMHRAWLTVSERRRMAAGKMGMEMGK